MTQESRWWRILIVSLQAVIQLAASESRTKLFLTMFSFSSASSIVVAKTYWFTAPQRRSQKRMFFSDTAISSTSTFKYLLPPTSLWSTMRNTFATETQLELLYFDCSQLVYMRATGALRRQWLPKVDEQLSDVEVLQPVQKKVCRKKCLNQLALEVLF